ncbi:MAG: DUF2278 family protein [Chryseolinea sp.]
MTPVTFELDRLKIAFLTGAIGLLLGRFLFALLYEKRVAKHVSKPPFAIDLPLRQHDIEGSPDFDEWTRQLQQREEGNHRFVDVSASIRSTISGGGFPRVVFKHLKRRPHYLMLVDSSSVLEQRTRMYSQISRMLFERGIDVDLFYFHASPDYCWSNRYPQGIKTEVLQQVFSSSYLILLTEGARLIDMSAGEVAAWVVRLFSGWQKRAVLTPLTPDQWGFVEAILANFFVILPATSGGQFLVRRFLDDEAVSFTTLKNHFSRSLSISKPLLDADLESIRASDVESYLKTECEREGIDASFVPMLICWAMATGVYDTPCFEVTVAIGKALEQKKKINGLVTTNHLLLITALPWLVNDKLPSILSDRLMSWLKDRDGGLPVGERIEEIARAAVIDVLNRATPEPGTRAAEEKQIAISEQKLLSNQTEYSTTAAIAALRSFERAGLVLNKNVAARVRTHFDVRKWMTAVVVAIACASVLNFVDKEVSPSSAKLAGFFILQKGQTDSAAYYNNLAVTFADSVRPWHRIFVGSDTFDTIANYLNRSIAIRPTVAAYQNILICEVNSLIDQNRSTRSGAETGSSQVNAVLAPLQLIKKGWVPTPDSLQSYLYFLILAQESLRTPVYARDNIWGPTFRDNPNADILRSVASDSLLPQRIRWRSAAIDVTENLIDSSRAVIVSAMRDKIYLHTGGPQKAIIATKLRKKKKREDGGKQPPIDIQQQTPSSALADSILQQRKNDSLRIAQKDVPAQIQNDLPTSTSTPSKKGSIAGQYGLLKGTLTRISKGYNSIQFEVNAGRNVYTAVVDFSRKGSPAEPNIIFAQPPRQFKEATQYSVGFNPIEKTRGAGALNYVELESNFKEGERVSPEEVYSYLQRYKGLEKGTIYVWGAFVSNGKKGSEINEIHMNQGSREVEYSEINAPYQDGAIVFDPPYGGGPIAMYVYFTSQTFNVDENGQPY